ncbi:MAG TPA: DUF11 domain-containing protein [Candidatus Peribacteraceae bacterium]|nr:DUF11 domain-containing protein [Candidatus Peribacteraceae bacterium]
MSLRKSLATLSVLSILALQVQSGTLPIVNPLVQTASAAQVVATSFSGQTQPLPDCGPNSPYGYPCNPGGHWQDLNGNDHGQPAKLLVSGLQPGDMIKISNIGGSINMGEGLASCRDGLDAADAANPKLIGIVQFTDANGHVVSMGGGVNNTNSTYLKWFDTPGGEAIPAGAVNMYGSFPDSKYSDNSGNCTFTITVIPSGPQYGPCQDIGGPTLQEYWDDAGNGKIQWSFNGGTATYTNNSSCDIIVKATTYGIYGNNNQQQQYDTSPEIVVKKGTSHTFQLNLPPCDYQIDIQPYWSLQYYQGHAIVHGQVVQHGGVCGQQPTSSSSASTTNQGICLDIGGPTLQEYWNDALTHKTTWSFNGGTATYHNGTPCPVVIHGEVYKIFGDNHQELYNKSQTVVVNPGETQTFNMQIPNCDYQIDLQPYNSLQYYNDNNGSHAIVHGIIVNNGGRCTNVVSSSSSSSPQPQYTDLSIVKNGPSTLTVGQNATFTMTVTNNGSVTGTNIQVVDSIDGRFQYVSSPDTSCSVQNNGATVLCNVSNIAPGQSRTVTLVLKVLGSQSLCQAHSTYNVASVTGNDVQTQNNISTFYSDLVCQASSSSVSSAPTTADLQLTKTPLQQSVQQGGTAGFSLSVYNGGPAAATNVSVNDTVPAGTTFNAGLSDQRCTLGTDNAVHCVFGTVSNGSTVGANVYFNTPQPQQNCQQMTLVNNANVSSANDPSPSNNYSTASVTLTCPAPQTADLSITKTALQTQQTQGSNVTFQINVHNNGSATAQNVVVTDDIHSALTYVANLSDSRCSSNGSTVSCNLGSINSNQTTTISLVFSTPQPQQDCQQSTITNMASVTSSNDSNSSNNVSNVASVTLTCPVPQNADLSITKIASQTQLTQGSNVTFQIRVQNSGPATAQNVVVTDNVPSGATFAPNLSDSRCALNGNTISCNLNTIASGDMKTLYLVFSTPMPTQSCQQSTINNTASVTSSNDSNGTNNTSNTASVTLTCPAPQNADLGITKTSNVTNATIGDSVTYTVRVTNLGPATSQNVYVNESLPNGLSNINVTVTQGSYSNGVWTIGTLTNGQYATLTMSASVTAAGAITNTATVYASTQDNNQGNNSASVTINSASNNADLAIMKTVNNSTPTVGGTVTYSVQVTNMGPATAQNVIAVDHLPAGVSFQSSNATQGSYDSQSGTWNIGTLPNGQIATLQITVTVNQAGTISNTATVSANNPDNNQGNNSSTVTINGGALLGCIDIYKQTFNPQGNLITPTAQFSFQMDGGLTVQNDSTGHAHIDGVTAGTHTITEQIPTGWFQRSVYPAGGIVTVVGGSNCAQVTFQDQQNNPNSSSSSSSSSVTGNPDLSISKTGPTSVTRGNNAVYTVTVNNIGQGDAQNVVVTDPIQGGLVFNSGASDGSCVLQNGNTVSCNLGTIMAGNSRTIAIGFTVPPIPNCTQTSITNTASVTTTGFDQNTGNNSASAYPTQINCPTPNTVDLAITKSANVNSVNQGSQLQYTINVQNLGSTQATNVVVTDPFPSQLQFVSSSDGRCSLQNNNSVTCNFGTLAGNASTSTTLTFNVPVINSCTNSMTISNTAYVTSNETDSNTANNQSQPVVTTINCGGSVQNSCVNVVAEAFDQNGNPVYTVPQFTFHLDNGQTAVNDTTGHATFYNVSTGTHYVSADSRSDWTLYNVTPSNGVNVTQGSCATIDFKFRQVFSSTTNFSITIDDGRYVVNPGDNLTYRVTVRNNSSVNANNVVVNATMPDQENVRFVSDNGYNNGRFITWSNLSFGPYETKVFTVNADVFGGCYNGGNCNNNCYNNNCGNNNNNCYYDNNGNYICNNNSNCYNNNCGNNNCYGNNCGNNNNNCYYDNNGNYICNNNSNCYNNNCNNNYNYNYRGNLTATATVAGSVANDTDVVNGNNCGNNCGGGNNPELSLTKNASASEVFPGGMIEYTVRLENTGNTQLQNIRVTDTLPSGVTVIDDGGADHQSGNQLEWDINSLAQNASRTITYRVTIGSYYGAGQIVQNNVEAKANQNVDEHASSTVQVIGLLPQTGFPGMQTPPTLHLHPITGSPTNSAGLPINMAVWVALAGLGAGGGIGFGRKFLLGL